MTFHSMLLKDLKINEKVILEALVKFKQLPKHFQN